MYGLAIGSKFKMDGIAHPQLPSRREQLHSCRKSIHFFKWDVSRPANAYHHTRYIALFIFSKIKVAPARYVETAGVALLQFRFHTWLKGYDRDSIHDDNM